MNYDELYIKKINNKYQVENFEQKNIIPNSIRIINKYLESINNKKIKRPSNLVNWICLIVDLLSIAVFIILGIFVSSYFYFGLTFFIITLCCICDDFNTSNSTSKFQYDKITKKFKDDIISYYTVVTPKQGQPDCRLYPRLNYRQNNGNNHSYVSIYQSQHNPNILIDEHSHSVESQIAQPNTNRSAIQGRQAISFNRNRQRHVQQQVQQNQLLRRINSDSQNYNNNQNINQSQSIQQSIVSNQNQLKIKEYDPVKDSKIPIHVFEIDKKDIQTVENQSKVFEKQLIQRLTIKDFLAEICFKFCLDIQLFI